MKCISPGLVFVGLKARVTFCSDTSDKCQISCYLFLFCHSLIFFSRDVFSMTESSSWSLRPPVFIWKPRMMSPASWYALAG